MQEEMNNQPTKEEINIKLAEFMGEKDPYIFKRGDMRRIIYTESLDALIPVMIKLKKHTTIEVCRHGSEDYHTCYFRDLGNEVINNIDEAAFDKTIQEAAALATYYAVMEDEKNG